MSANPDTIGQAREALSFIPPDLSREEWVKVCMAAHDAGLGADEVESWSATGDKFNRQDFRAMWRSIKPGRGVSAASLFHIAKEYGYGTRKATPRPALRVMERPAHKPATVDAAAIWNRCEPATADHPYIKAKGGTPEGLRVVPVGDPLRLAGEGMAGALVVPAIRADGSIATLQLITVGDTKERLKAASKPDKLNLAGASFDDGCFIVGSWSDRATCYLCEGIGQAWAAWRATGKPGVVCFGWGRVRAVAERLRKGGATLVLLPDVGKEEKADQIAREVGASVVRMPNGWPDNADVNDYAQREGWDALEHLLSNAGKPAQRYQLLGRAELAKLPPLVWLVRGVLPATGLAALFGPSASGKSFLAFDLATAIADGARWFGHRTISAPVVYAALEGEAGFKVRVQAWEAYRGRHLPDGLQMLLQPFRLTEPEDVRDLAAVVPAGAVVFLDTLNRAAPTAEENNSKDMGEVLEAAKALQALTGGLVVVIHHAGKDTAKGMRGHSSLFAAMDAVIEVSRDGDSREWRVAKAKDGEDGKGHRFRLQVELLGHDSDGEAITSCVVVADTTEATMARVCIPRGGNQKLVYEALREPLKHGELGKPGVPPTKRAIRLEEAIRVGASALVEADSNRRTARAKDAVKGLCAGGVYGQHEGWLWTNA